MRDMREEFEKTILENPHNITSHAIYADWLLEQADPFGDFIHLQLMFEDNPEGEQLDALQQRETELLNGYGRQWLGPMARFLLEGNEGFTLKRLCDVSFRYGWIWSIRVNQLTDSLLQTINACPQTRMIRQLAVEEMSDEECRCLLRNNLAERLRVVDFSYGKISDFGARLIHESRNIRELEKLNLNGNPLTLPICQRLKRTLPCVEIEEVRDWYPDERVNPFLIQWERFDELQYNYDYNDEDYYSDAWFERDADEEWMREQEYLNRDDSDDDLDIPADDDDEWD